MLSLTWMFEMENNRGGDGMTTPHGTWGFDLTAMDRKADPRNDFDRYANGAWLDATEIPADQTKWGMFAILENENRLRLKAILESLTMQADTLAGNEDQKLRDFYRTALDMKKRNHNGTQPLEADLKRIAAITTLEELTPLIARLHLIGAGTLWGIGVDQDPKDSTTMALFFLQGGIGLPDREYYLADDKAKLRDQYRVHMRKMFELLGENADAVDRMTRSIMKIETELAKVSWQRARHRDIKAQCNYFTIEGLEDLMPSINWRTYFEMLTINTTSAILVGQPGFFAKVNELLQNKPLQEWRWYLTWKLISATASHLNQEFVDEKFRFFGQILAGQKELKPLWERGVIIVDQLLGEILGKLYVKRHFPSEAETKMRELIAHIVEALEQRIKNLPWMGSATKDKAIEKLYAIKWKLGYPEKWRDYSGLAIGSDAHVANVLRAEEFNTLWWLSMAGKPVDPTLWEMSPQTVNAYANHGLVEMVFPAGILQWPFFSATADDAVNYGAIGFIIGHELTHHFDDKGSDFDSRGNLNGWWTPEDRRTFEQLAAGLVEQFNGYELYGKHIDGKLTLGENISDLGGIVIAFQAYQKHLAKLERQTINDFTPEQRFFLGYAQVWREKRRQERVLQLLITDPHSPEKFRVNGPLSNTTEFYTAFGIQEGDGMYRQTEKRVEIW